MLSGHLRYYDKTYNELKKNIIDILNPDIFIHTWDNKGIQKRDSGYKIDMSEIVDIDHVKELYKPKKMVVEKYTEDIRRELSPGKYRQQHRVPVENILSMFRKIELCDKLRLDFESELGIKYDLVIKCRPDILFNTPIPKEELSVVNDTIWVPDTGNKQINDHLAFSNGDNMEYYSSLYSKINDYYYDEAPNPPNITEKGCCIHAETMLNYHLRKLDTLVLRETKTGYKIPHKNRDIIDKFQNM